ncbi:DUF2510 domain-containing protein [Nocardia sp. NPDC004123]
MTQASKDGLNEHSVYGLGASIACAIAIGYLAAAAHLPAPVQGTLVSTGLALPAAIHYQVRTRRRSPAADIADIRQQGWPQRPIGLVVALFVAALFFVDSIGGVLISAGGTDNDPGATIVIMAIVIALVGIGMAFVSARASHYLRDHPYLWTMAAVGLALVLRILILAVAWHALTADMGDNAPPFSSELLPLFLAYAVILSFCLAGAFCGRRRHDQFVAARLAKLEKAGLQPLLGQQAFTRPYPRPTGPTQAVPPPAFPPAGWYADPEGLRNIDRWWNGAQWTDHRRNRP